MIESSNRNDFQSLVRVFAHRNEPVHIPASMGACMIKGYNNWDRVARYKRQCGENFDFNHMKAYRELYQDTFLILSDAEYSGVTAEMLGLSDDEWHKLSKLIRRARSYPLLYPAVFRFSQKPPLGRIYRRLHGHRSCHWKI